MAIPRATTVMQQNSNAIAGVQVDTAVYVGTGATIPVVQVGREASVYVLEGVQTAVTVNVIADVTNAYAGATITFRRGTAAFGTSILNVLNATTGGIVVATSSGLRDTVVTFNGVQWK